jgi:hypothetical protein
MAKWRTVGVPLGAVALAFVLALTLGACGGGSDDPGPCPVGQTGVPPNCMSIEPPCTQTNIYQNNGPVPARTLVYFDFSVPDSGRLDVTMDWTYTSSPMAFYVVPANTCTVAEFNAGTCNFLMRSDPSGVKPRKLSQSNFTAGNYRWIVANFGTSDESAALQIVLSKGTSCPALVGVPPSASSRDGEALPAIGQALHR